MALADIQNRIISDARQEAAALVEAAKERAATQIERERTGAAAEEAESADAARKEGDTLKIKMVSPVKISAKNEFLAARQEQIEEVYRRALADMKKLGARQYRAAITSLLETLPSGIGGEIVPATNKASEVRKAVSAFSKTRKGSPRLSVKRASKQFSGGFIFRSEKFNLDCSFESLMKDVRDKTENRVAELLFGKEGV